MFAVVNTLRQGSCAAYPSIETFVKYKSIHFNMASALESRDHFKDVGTDGVRRNQSFTHNQPRQDRLPSLDNVPSLAFGSTFGVGKSLWNNTSSIWRSTNKFMDGAADEGMFCDHYI